MGSPVLSKLLATLAALFALMVSAPALADARHAPAAAPSCHASSDATRGFSDMLDDAEWICSNEDWRANQPVAWLRFDADSWSDQNIPRHFVSRIARHNRIEFAALDADGTMRTLSHNESAGRPFGGGPVFELALPEITEATQAMLVRIERPHSIPLLTEAKLAVDPDDVAWSQHEMILLALVIGMLVLPLCFDVSFFIVLRERSVMLHAMMVVSMMTYVMFAGGLISVFVTLPVPLIAVLAPLSWAIGCGVSALFLACFLEPRAQSRWMRRATMATGIWTIAVPGFFALQFDATQPIDDQAYFLTFLPTLFIVSAALIEAVWRGSRSARFVAAAWLPIILASTDRLLRGLGFYVGPSELDQALYVATGLEVIMISMAIADRFLAIRRERDEALTEARMLGRLSQRDPLTGLMNRRAIEARFTELRREGFDTFALVDLDLFKDINDRFGHQVGDAALIACAEALRGTEDRDSVAFRLGGEEFVVVLKGEHARQRAEAVRQAIPLRIARDVEGLDRPVTASMGVVELPRAASEAMSFEDYYARADMLLYDAKANGRNRMYYEKLTVFNEAPPPRSQSKEVAA
ncbi:MAG: diguanylate cyclase [Pseudomonadota bacterium]